GVVRGCDVGVLGNVATRDVHEAASMLEAMVADASPVPPLLEHQADLLAERLAATPNLSITDFARALNFSREGLSRLFRRAYGVCAVMYRGELRARAAWRACLTGDEPLAALAADLGFADQSHMTRAVHSLTGAPPAVWRRWAR